jgi:tetratricopeptide (TPR) repeat protein
LSKFDEAIKVYDKVIEINLHNSKAWYNKGKVLYHLNRANEALIAYDKAIEINPHLGSLVR